MTRTTKTKSKLRNLRLQLSCGNCGTVFLLHNDVCDLLVNLTTKHVSGFQSFKCGCGQTGPVNQGSADADKFVEMLEFAPEDRK